MPAVNSTFLNLLCSPRAHRPLQLADGGLMDDQGGRYPIREGIAQLLPAAKPGGWQRFYDAAAPAYDASVQLGDRLGLGSELRIRAEVLAKLGLPDRPVIVEVGCGTGANRAAFGAEARYVGLDLSFGMLRRAQRKTQALGLRSHWAQAEATALPIRDAQADLGFAMGVLQHVGQPAAALEELARITRPGASMLLIDERRSLKKLARRLSLTNSGLQDLSNWLETQTNLHVIEAGFFSEYFVLKAARR